MRRGDPYDTATNNDVLRFCGKFGFGHLIYPTQKAGRMRLHCPGAMAVLLRVDIRGPSKGVHGGRQG